MKALIPTILFLLVTATAQAATLKGGPVACLTEDLFDQAIQAVVSKDERAFKYLLDNGCIITKAGVPVSVLDRGLFSGKVKVRAYFGGNKTFVLWTTVENIVE